MAWLYLLVAGLCEIAWPVGLKRSQTPGRRALGVIIAVVGIAASGALPSAPPNAVWTGIGAAGTFVVGIAFYGDSASAGWLVSVGWIVTGIIGLKLAHGSGGSGARSSNRLHVFIARQGKSWGADRQKEPVGVPGVGDALAGSGRDQHHCARPNVLGRLFPYLDPSLPFQDQIPLGHAPQAMPAGGHSRFYPGASDRHGRIGS